MSSSPILIISGTNRPGSNCLRVARMILSHYQNAGISAELFSLIDLPREIFDGSAYATKPPAMQALQQRVLDSLGLHIVTPEYNGSFPGVLKYFIDMLKFPESFQSKPVAFVGEAGGVWGALRPVEQLQLIFSYRNAHVFPDRVFISAVKDKFDANDKLLDSAIDQRLAKQALGFNKFAQKCWEMR